MDSDDDFFPNAIGEHVAKHVGPVTNVFHEIVPEVVKIDLLVVEPTEARPYTTVITCGMSDLPMRVPIENPEDLGLVPELRFAELMLCLPADWPLDPAQFQDPSVFWPFRWLKRLARLPHIHGDWLGLGHTIPNGDPAVPLAPGTELAGWLIDEPVLFPQELQKLRARDRAINFYAAVPIYAEEMTLKLRKGGAALGQMFDRAKVNELIDPQRKNVAVVM